MTENLHLAASNQMTHTLTLAIRPGDEAWLRFFVHALAQTPESLHLAVSGVRTGSLQRLISAYGLADRVTEIASAKSEAPDVGSPEEVIARLRLASKQSVGLRLPAFSLSGRPMLGEVVEALTPPDAGPSRMENVDDLTGSRIAIITNIPNHYRVPLFNSLGKRLRAQGASLLVLFLGHTYGRRSWVDLPELNFEHIYLSSLGVRMSRAWHPFIPADLEKSLKDFNPSSIVCAGFSPLVAGRAQRVARKTGASFAIWSGETSTGITGSNKARMWQRRRLLRRTDAALAYGSRAEDYLLALRPDLPVVHVRNTIPIPPANAPAVSSPKTVELLAVAEQRSGKRLDLVIDAASTCRDLDWHLTIVGEGPDRAALQERAGDLGDRVTFTGAVPSSKIGDYYHRADVFLFPSEIDVFGLVVVEAFGAGLATLVSRIPGAVADLCADGVNSVVVPGQSEAEWGRSLRKVISDEAFRVKISEAARRTISSRWTIDHSAAAFLAGISAAARATS